MDKNSNFGQLFEQGKAAVDDSASNAIDTTKKQITGQQSSVKNQPNIQSSELQSQLSSESREIINDFYAPSDATNQPQNLEEKEESLAKVRKELQALQSGLHQSTYYEPLFAYEKKKKEAEAAQQEEVRDEQNKMTELDKQQKKKEDLAKFRAERSVEIKGAVAG